MPQGLQVWDEFGNLIVDTSERLTLYLGTITLQKGTKETATITDAGFSQGKPFYVCKTITSKGSVDVRFSGNTMTVKLVDGLYTSGDYSVSLVYGVY